MDRAGIPFGVVAIVVGLGIGWLMLAFPENTNPAYPIWIALLAPLAFVFGGLLMLAHATGRMRLMAFALKAFVVCLLMIVNWAAFVASSLQCRVVVSFLGVALFERQPDEAECREGLRMLIASIDFLILVPFLVFAWRKWAGARNESIK